MTIYGTPGGTPLNTTPFQGTQPGNAAQATLQQQNPGVGLFPPNSNNASGDTVLAAQSRGSVPANVLVTNLGVRDSRPGRSASETLSHAGANGAGETAAAPYAWPNSAASGGNSLGAGGLNQTPNDASGEQTICVAGAPASFPTIASPAQYQG